MTSIKTIGYSHTADSYDELHREEQWEKLLAIANRIKIPKKFKLLDLGCGTGLSSSLFNCQKVGLDASIEMLKVSSFPELKRVCGQAETLPFRDKTFDGVICLTAIHNFNNYKTAVEEIKRVCKGIVVISVLKRARQAKVLLKHLRRALKPIEELDTEKDTILIGNS